MIKVKNTRLQVLGIPTKQGIVYLKVGQEYTFPEGSIDIEYLKKLHLKYEVVGEHLVEEVAEIQEDSVVEKAEKKIEVLKKKGRRKKEVDIS